MGAGFGGEAAVAALGHLVDIHFQPLFAFVAVQPEQRAGEAPGLHGQFAKLLFQRGKVLPGGLGCRDRSQRAEEDSGGGAKKGESSHGRFHVS